MTLLKGGCSPATQNLCHVHREKQPSYVRCNIQIQMLAFSKNAGKDLTTRGEGVPSGSDGWNNSEAISDTLSDTDMVVAFTNSGSFNRRISQ